MKVQLLVSREGPTISQVAGQVVDVDDDEGLRMIDAGQAVAPKAAERAISKQKVEKALK